MFRHLNRNRLRIALLTHSVNPRGGVVHVLELGRALMARGHAVTIVAPAMAGQGLFRATPCHVALAPVGPPQTGLIDTVRERIAAMREHVHKLIPHEGFDVFHAHDGIGANALADLVDEGFVERYLRTVHHVDRFADGEVQALEDRSIRRAARVLCVSEVWRTRLAEALGVDARVAPNGVDLARFSPQQHLGDQEVRRRYALVAGAPVALTVGGVEARKNTVRLLEAFAMMRRRKPDARLIVAGGASLLDHGPEMQRFLVRAAALGLAIGPRGPVTITRPLPDDDIAALYRAADVVAMPSLLEGFGLAALEGLASGAPIVVSRIPPFTEHFDETTASFADPHDASSIADALLAALARGRHDAVPAVCHRYAWARSAARHEALYFESLVLHGSPTMPAMHYRVRWPDASTSDCYSPSLVIKDYFVVGESYPLPDFLQRVREATQVASDRVSAKYGFACSLAADQLATIEAEAARFDASGDARVGIVAFSA